MMTQYKKSIFFILLALTSHTSLFFAMAPEDHICTYQPEDLPAIMQIVQDNPTFLAEDPENPDASQKILTSAENTTKTYRLENEVAGFIAYCTYTPDYNEPQKEIFIQGAPMLKEMGLLAEDCDPSSIFEHQGFVAIIGVSADHRRKGIAQQLMHHAITEMQNDPEINFIQLTVKYENEAAIALYEKMGFQRIQTIPNYAYIYRLPINQ